MKKDADVNTIVCATVVRSLGILVKYMAREFCICRVWEMGEGGKQVAVKEVKYRQA